MDPIADVLSTLMSLATAKLSSDRVVAVEYWTVQVKYGPGHEKNYLFGIPPGSTQTGLYNHRRWIEA